MEFLLLLVSSLLLTARAAAAASNPILDVDGNELRRGHLYYARSVRRPGGGLTLAAPNASCPLNVAQPPFYDYSGQPLAFFPKNDDIVQMGRTLYIMFPEPTACPQSTVWTRDREAGFVTTGGTTSSETGPHNNRFAIRKAGDASSQPNYYQVEVCPCRTGVQWASCQMGCLGSLGLIEVVGNVLLGTNSERPHTIMFVKVKQATATQ